MVSILSDNGRYALALARRGFDVLPCCWPDDQGQCACPKHHTESKETGKAPLTSHGVNDASKHRTTVETWWHHNPHANVAIALAPDFIMLDPDSADARLECYKHGVPDTLVRISRNNAFIFRAPTNLGHVQFTHRGESKAIDILNGYCLVFGLHSTGARVFLENPTVAPAPTPAWVLEWIEKYRAESTIAPDLDPDAPPVRLGSEGMKWWTGEKTVEGTNGEIDRSATLFSLGLALAGTNATAEAIVDALENRDQALGYSKYAERKDAVVRYAEIAAKAVDNQLQQRRRRHHDQGHFRPLPQVQVKVRP